MVNNSCMNVISQAAHRLSPKPVSLPTREVEATQCPKQTNYCYIFPRIAYYWYNHIRLIIKIER